MKSCLILLLLGLSLPTMAQEFPRSATAWQKALDDILDNSFDDRLYLSTNGNYFVSGEQLQFSVFCISPHTQRLAKLSRIAYVALVNEKNEPVVQTKVSIREGRGYGDIFMASSYPSGLYTLVAFTSLQKSLGKKGLFRKKITLINPFGSGISEAENTIDELRVTTTGSPPVSGVLNSFRLQHVPEDFDGSTARVLGEAGEVLSSFEIEAPNQIFAFVPSGKDRLVLTNTDGDNSFVAIPEPVEKGVVSSIEQGTNAYTATIRSPDPITVDILFRANAQFILHHEATLSKAYQLKLPYENLPVAPISMEVWQDEELLDQITFSHALNNRPLSIATDQDQYRPREKVTLKVSSSLSSSLSFVARRTTHLSRDEKTIHQLLLEGVQAETRPLPHGQSTPKAYPLTDIHGDILSGTVLDAQGNPLANMPVFITEATRQFHLLTAHTNKEGKFVVVAPESIQSQWLYAQSSDSAATVQFDNEWFAEYPTPNQTLRVAQDDLKLIEEKSLYSQIENAYYLSKAQTSLPLENQLFYGTASKSYKLADYTRFSTLEETLREFIPGIVVNRENGAYGLTILDLQSRLSKESTLVLLDGLPIRNINDLMAMDALDIHQIEFVRDEYFYGPLLFSGIISIQTNEGNLRGFKVANEVIRHAYIPVQPAKQYYRPSYPEDDHRRIPDYRTALYWDPVVEMKGEERIEIAFYTSDVPGDYEIVAEGFDEEGNAILSKARFAVR